MYGISMKRAFRNITILLCLCVSSSTWAQDSLGFWEPSSTFHKKRTLGVGITEGVGYVGTMVALDALWYRDFPRSSFHFFNDNDEWLQVDKVGHTFTAYIVGKAGFEVLDWAGVDRKKAIWYGGGLGFVFQTSLEVFDGFSEEWGASSGDLIANTVGTGILIGQEYAWEEQRLTLKFSAHLTEYAQYRPNVLGSSAPERIIKDYNGQTYWVSCDVRSFLQSDSKWPEWLNVAVGYGADGMTHGSPEFPDLGPGISIATFPRQRVFYVSPDINLQKLVKKPGLLKTFVGSISWLKFPAPAISYGTNDGLRGHWLFF